MPKSNKKNEKKKGAQALPLLTPSDGTIGTQKQQNIKIKNKKEGAQAPPMLKLHDGIQLHQK
jgi:hypothetical protein